MECPEKHYARCIEHSSLFWNRYSSPLERTLSWMPDQSFRWNKKKQWWSLVYWEDSCDYSQPIGRFASKFTHEDGGTTAKPVIICLDDFETFSEPFDVLVESLLCSAKSAFKFAGKSFTTLLMVRHFTPFSSVVCQSLIIIHSSDQKTLLYKIFAVTHHSFT